jgi:hypothetical protein
LSSRRPTAFFTLLLESDQADKLYHKPMVKPAAAYASLPPLMHKKGGLSSGLLIKASVQHPTAGPQFPLSNRKQRGSSLPPEANEPATPAGPASYLPVPTSCTVCVPTASLTFKVADRAPVTVGVNVTVIVQSHPALRLVPQPDFALKSPRSGPPTFAADGERLVHGELRWTVGRSPRRDD